MGGGPQLNSATSRGLRMSGRVPFDIEGELFEALGSVEPQDRGVHVCFSRHQLLPEESLQNYFGRANPNRGDSQSNASG